MNKTPITSRPRRWRRPVPCPVCGNRDIRFRNVSPIRLWNRRASDHTNVKER